jgi:hypothetical protein
VELNPSSNTTMPPAGSASGWCRTGNTQPPVVVTTYWVAQVVASPRVDSLTWLSAETGLVDRMNG